MCKKIIYKFIAIYAFLVILMSCSSPLNSDEEIIDKLASRSLDSQGVYLNQIISGGWASICVLGEYQVSVVERTPHATQINESIKKNRIDFMKSNQSIKKFLVLFKNEFQEIKVVAIPYGNTINDIKMKGDVNCTQFDQTQLHANKVDEELILTLEEVKK